MPHLYFALARWLNRLRKLGVATAILVVSTSALTTASQSPANLTVEPGVYVQTSRGFAKILGQMVSFQRTGSTLASTMTVGIVSKKGNVQLLGAHSQTLTGAHPVFYFIPAKQEADAGGTGGDLVLIRLQVTPEGDRRQFEVAAQGAARASSGISITHQIQLLRFEETPGVYKLTPAVELASGEYAFYLVRGEGMAAYVYDFSVPGAGPNVVVSEHSTIPLESILKAAQKGCPKMTTEAVPGRGADFQLEVTRQEGQYVFQLLDRSGNRVHQVYSTELESGMGTLCLNIMSDTNQGSGEELTPAFVTREKIESNEKAQAAQMIAPIANLSETPRATSSILSVETIQVSSNPDGADIYADGEFVGNTPAILKLGAGKHVVKITFSGYSDWFREILAIAGSEARLIANLEKQR